MGRSAAASAAQVEEAILFEDADCTALVAVVGESHYQDAIRAVCGSHRWEDVSFDCIAALVAEPSNPYDSNAVMVQIDGRRVGYLSREDAVAYGPMIRDVAGRGQFIASRARIAGHGPGGKTSNLGVFLHLPPATSLPGTHAPRDVNLGRGMRAGHGLPELVRELVDETLASGKHDDFRIIASRAESGDYVQWIPGPSGGGVLVEIADPEANEVPPRPLK